MKNENLDVKLIWIQFEDHLVPQLRLNVVDRAVYSHLFRHSRLVGKCRLRFSIAWLSRGTRLCDGAARMAVRRLAARGALRLIERSKSGHTVEVRLPEEIRGFGAHNLEGGNPARAVRAGNIEEVDFLKTKALRQAIHAREHGLCFYCQRRTSADKRCLDHVVSLVNLGGNSYRNLVSCCVECNSKKGEMSGADFLLWLGGGFSLPAPACRRPRHSPLATALQSPCPPRPPFGLNFRCLIIMERFYLTT
jgi:HNH endonuclease